MVKKQSQAKPDTKLDTKLEAKLETKPETNPETTKDKILEAGLSILRDKGVSGTSMNDIIRESGISKGGVYHYFPSKDELLLGLCDYFFEKYISTSLTVIQSEADIAERSAIEMIDLLLQQQEAIIDQMNNDMKLFMDLYLEAMHNDDLKRVFNTQYKMVFEILCQLINEGKSQGDIRNDIETELLSAAMLAIFDGFGVAHQIIEGTEKYPEYSLKAARILIDGAKTTH